MRVCLIVWMANEGLDYRNPLCMQLDSVCMPRERVYSWAVTSYFGLCQPPSLWCSCLPLSDVGIFVRHHTKVLATRERH